VNLLDNNSTENRSKWTSGPTDLGQREQPAKSRHYHAIIQQVAKQLIAADIETAPACYENVLLPLPPADTDTHR